MSRPQDVGDNKNYYADDDTGFDSEGYLLIPGDDSGNRQVQKYPADGAAYEFVGVNHMSTYNYDDTEVEMGQPVAVHQEGEVNVLAEPANYTFGEEVHAGDSNAGVADKSGNTATGVAVGSVAEDRDLSGESGPAILAVNITGRV